MYYLSVLRHFETSYRYCRDRIDNVASELALLVRSDTGELISSVLRNLRNTR